jgi:cytochrome bd-type quinol oxidase subunit 2
MQAFGSYEIAGYVSRLQMVFLIFVGAGLVLSGVAYANQTKKQKMKNPSFILLLHLTVSMMFFAIAVLGLTSQLKGTDFWGETTFKEIQSTLFFNSLTLASFLVLGTLQVILSIMFLKTRMLQPHRLSKAAKTLTLTSGALLIVKAIIDYPLIKEAIFISSYMLKIPFPNNIISFATPIIYLSAQIPITMILLHDQKPQARQ